MANPPHIPTMPSLRATFSFLAAGLVGLWTSVVRAQWSALADAFDPTTGAASEEAPLIRALHPAVETPEIFEREPLGFDAETLRALGDSVAEGVRQFLTSVAEWPSLSATDVLAQIAPWLTVVLLVALGWFLDRRFKALARRLSARVVTPKMWGPTRIYLAGLGIRVAGRLAAPALAVLLSYVPVQGLFMGATWTVALSVSLTVLFFMRVATTAMSELLGSPITYLDAEARARLLAFGRRAARLIGWFLVVDAIVYRLVDAPAAHHVVDFGLRALMVVVGLRAYVLRADLLAFFHPEENVRYADFWNLVERVASWILALSIALLVLYAVGFRRLAGAVLPRSYAVIGLVVLVFLVRRTIERWRDEEGGPTSRWVRQLVDAAFDPLGRAVISAIVFVFALDLAGIYDPLVQVLQQPLFVVGSTAITAFNLLKAVVIIVSSVLISRFLRIALDWTVLSPRHVEEGVAYAISTSANYAVIAFGIGMALVTAGLDLSAMAVFAGALGVGIGLGLQEITRNVVSGFILLYGGGVKKGDLITVSDQHYGRVSSIGARAVYVRTYDGIDLVIPSSDLVNSTIINWTHRSPVTRLHVTVGVSYNAKPEEVKAALLEAAKRLDRVHLPQRADVWLRDFGDSSVNYDLVIWVDLNRYPRDETMGRVLYFVWDVLHERGIEIPFPQRDLHIRTVPEAWRGGPPADALEPSEEEPE